MRRVTTTLRGSARLYREFLGNGQALSKGAHAVVLADVTMRAQNPKPGARGVEGAAKATSTSGNQNSQIQITERSNCVQTARDAYDAYDDVFALLDRGELDSGQLRHCSSCRKTKDVLRDFTGELKTCRFCLHDRKRSAKKRRLQARIAKAVAEYARREQPTASVVCDVDVT